MDSLYFNAKAPLDRNGKRRVWPDVVTRAMTRPDAEHDPHPPPPPVRDQSVGGARPKRSIASSNNSNGVSSGSSSIVGKYLGDGGREVGAKGHKKRRAPQPPTVEFGGTPAGIHIGRKEEEEVAVGKLVSLSPEPQSRNRRLEARTDEQAAAAYFADGMNGEWEEPPWRRLLLEGERRTREEMARERRQREDGTDPNGIPMRPPPKESSEYDLNEREKLREMLSGLRKDPFDDELESNDGSFFPCEFCGDPYPVEFIMRHQVRGWMAKKTPLA